jgi:hypothetical protein
MGPSSAAAQRTTDRTARASRHRSLASYVARAIPVMSHLSGDCAPLMREQVRLRRVQPFSGTGGYGSVA